jgi:hypothetical protein
MTYALTALLFVSLTSWLRPPPHWSHVERSLRGLLHIPTDQTDF